MAQKAAKSLAMRNASVLNQLHLVSLAVNGLFVVLRILLRYRSATRRTYLLYFILSAPAFAIELWFELHSRPRHNALGDLQRAGDDLEAKGITEYLFDVLYWTWATIALAAVVGNRAWWLWLAVPLYSVYALWAAFGSAKQAMSGLAGGGGEGDSQSNRQKKMEKRGGQRTKHQ